MTPSTVTPPIVTPPMALSAVTPPAVTPATLPPATPWTKPAALAYLVAVLLVSVLGGIGATLASDALAAAGLLVVAWVLALVLVPLFICWLVWPEITRGLHWLRGVRLVVRLTHVTAPRPQEEGAL